jgi:hypothetical protein
MHFPSTPLERVWKVLFRPLNRPTKAPAIWGTFTQFPPKFGGSGGLLKQALRKCLKSFKQAFEA